MPFWVLARCDATFGTGTIVYEPFVIRECVVEQDVVDKRADLGRQSRERQHHVGCDESDLGRLSGYRIVLKRE